VKTESSPRAIGEIRRHYETTKSPFTSSARARADILRVLSDRKAIQRAGEALMAAAYPYSGDPALKQAIDDFTAVLEGRAPRA
jgi:hypothetical protein